MADGDSDTDVDAALVAFTAQSGAEIDGTFRAAMAAAGRRGGPGLRQRHGAGFGVLIEFRTSLAWPTGIVTPRCLAETMRYRDPATASDDLATAVRDGWITRDADGTIRATARGHAFLDDLYASQADTLGVLWSGHEATVSRLATRTAKIVDAAARAPVMAEGSFAAMTPTYEPVGTPDTVLLLNRLSALRYHRSDAHAAAWRTAGLTAAEMVALQELVGLRNDAGGERRDPGGERRDPGGERRDAIEAHTDRLAAAPFRIVPAAERPQFVEGLRSLSEILVSAASDL
ncbi:MAG TPA: hypothetical protein VFR11_05075 [Micromonosporaceae bacterium]|nr:hypothetical protein [Micromonosporaceae bacterium]